MIRIASRIVFWGLYGESGGVWYALRYMWTSFPCSLWLRCKVYGRLIVLTESPSLQFNTLIR